MAKKIAENYLDELHMQRTIWQRKPGLRAVYHAWFKRIVANLSPNQPTMEVGAGCGSFHEYYPSSIATDVMQGGPWIDQIVDARELTWEADSIGNVVMIDCLHHLPRPIKFLESLRRVLKPGGRAILFEPAATPWACWFWKRFHHEPVDLNCNFIEDERAFVERGLGEPENPGFMYANMGTAQWLFQMHWAETRKFVPGLRLQELTFSDFLVYPLTGGFSYRSYAPRLAIPTLHAIERILLRPILARWLGLRMMVVLEKSAG